MRWLDRLERRFGAWSIEQFPLFIVAATGAIYLLVQANPSALWLLGLDPFMIRHGQFWRLLTFLFIPPTWNVFFLFFWLYLIYIYARGLEQEWGSFRFCVFYFVGALATIIAAMWIVGSTLSNVPLNTTIFLAFATLYPDFELLLFFILPVKVKYLAWLLWLFLVWELCVGDFATRVTVAASLVNYLLFFGPDLWQKAVLRAEVYRNRRRFRGR